MTNKEERIIGLINKIYPKTEFESKLENFLKKFPDFGMLDKPYVGETSNYLTICRDGIAEMESNHFLIDYYREFCEDSEKETFQEIVLSFLDNSMTEYLRLVSLKGDGKTQLDIDYNILLPKNKKRGKICSMLYGENDFVKDNKKYPQAIDYVDKYAKQKIKEVNCDNVLKFIPQFMKDYNSLYSDVFSILQKGQK